MKGLKRKQKFTRTLEAPSSTNQKTTNFDYAAFREENEMRANENACQVRDLWQHHAGDEGKEGAPQEQANLGCTAGDVHQCTGSFSIIKKDYVINYVVVDKNNQKSTW